MRAVILPWLFSLLALITIGDTYSTYYVESECWKNGSVSYVLSEEGERSAAILKATLRPSIVMGLHCRVKVLAPQGSHVLLSVREVDLRTNLLDGSCKDYLEIDRPLCSRIVRYDEEHHFESRANEMDVVYHTSTDGLDNRTLSGYKGFTVVVTAFKKGSEGGGVNVSSDSEVFRCSNDNFVWAGLTCDGHNNCGDLSDEAEKGDSNCGGRGSTVLIILGVLIVAMLVIMCIATLLCSKNEAVRRFSTRLRSRTISIIPRFGSR